MVISAADPGLSVDTDGLAEAQSGAAPTAEGNKYFSFCFLSCFQCVQSVKKNTFQHLKSSLLLKTTMADQFKEALAEHVRIMDILRKTVCIGIFMTLCHLFLQTGALENVYVVMETISSIGLRWMKDGRSTQGLRLRVGVRLDEVIVLCVAVLAWTLPICGQSLGIEAEQLNSVGSCMTYCILLDFLVIKFKLL